MRYRTFHWLFNTLKCISRFINTFSKLNVIQKFNIFLCYQHYVLNQFTRFNRNLRRLIVLSNFWIQVHKVVLLDRFDNLILLKTRNIVWMTFYYIVISLLHLCIYVIVTNRFGRRNLVWNNVAIKFQLYFDVVPTSCARWENQVHRPSDVFISTKFSSKTASRLKWCIHCYKITSHVAIFRMDGIPAYVDGRVISPKKKTVIRFRQQNTHFFTPENPIGLVVKWFLLLQISIHGCVKYSLKVSYSKMFSKQLLKRPDSFVNKQV